LGSDSVALRVVVATVVTSREVELGEASQAAKLPLGQRSRPDMPAPKRLSTVGADSTSTRVLDPGLLVHQAAVYARGAEPTCGSMHHRKIIALGVDGPADPN
jgi:hypothetical protein